MKTSLIKIGNSRGVRLPKSFIEEADLGTDIDILVDRNKIVISRIKSVVNDDTLLSEKALSDWLNKDEEEAWENL